MIKETISPEQELAALRRSVRDLAALATLPAIWISSDLTTGLQNIAEVLSTAVRASFLFVRVRRASGEIVDAAAQHALGAQRGAVDHVRRHLARHLDLDGNEFTSSIPAPDGRGQLRVAYSHVAMEGRLRGVVIACAPAETGVPDHERMLLHTGAAQVAILLQRDATEECRRSKPKSGKSRRDCSKG